MLRFFLFLIFTLFNFKGEFDEDEFIENIYDKGSAIFLNKDGYWVNDNQEILPCYLLLNFKTKISNNLLENKKIIEDQENVEKWLKEEFEKKEIFIKSNYNIFKLAYKIYEKNYEYKLFSHILFYPNHIIHNISNDKYEKKYTRIPQLNGYFIEKKITKLYMSKIVDSDICYKQLAKNYDNFTNNLDSFYRNLNQLNKKKELIYVYILAYKSTFLGKIFNGNVIENKKKIELIDQKIKFINEKIKNFKNLGLQD